MPASLASLNPLKAWCPNCADAALPLGPACVPGVYTLFRSECPSCRRPYFVHFPIGFAGDSNLVLDPQSGRAHTESANRWYADNLEAAWRQRSADPVRLTRINLRPLRKPLLVDGIDYLFGHCLQHLFDLPRLIRKYPDRDIVVLVQDFARWLVPDGVAEIWSVDIPLRKGHLWHDDLARQIDELATELPSPEIGGDIGQDAPDIERFTRTAPFDLLSAAALERRRLTLIWRNDRCWTLNPARRTGEAAIAEQLALMTALAEALRQAMPDIEIGVAGMGREGQFPDWIEDRRTPAGEAIDEMGWLRLYRTSHVVLGVHGSNMLLPASHAATTIELVPLGKWQNTSDGYDFVRRRDHLRVLREFRFLPMSIPIVELAGVVQVMIRLARVEAFREQWKLLPDEDTRRRFRQRYGSVYTYPQL